jgi:hypothetical protein
MKSRERRSSVWIHLVWWRSSEIIARMVTVRGITMLWLWPWPTPSTPRATLASPAAPAIAPPS